MKVLLSTLSSLVGALAPRRHPTNRFVFAAAIGIAMLWPQIADAACSKWQSMLGPCQYLNNAPGCSDPLPFATKRAYYAKLYVEDAQTACENSYINDPYTGPVFADQDESGEYASCIIDTNMNGVIDAGDASLFNIGLQQVPREPICDRIPNGPYRVGGPYGITGPDSGQAGKAFTSTRKTAIKNAHLQLNQNTFLSDIYLWGTQPVMLQYNTAPFPGEPGALSFSQWVWDAPDDGPFVPTRLWNRNHVNVDHIIPRKDIHGCDCGPNSYANALLISAGFNVKMSNNSEDPDREKIVEMFTLPPP